LNAITFDIAGQKWLINHNLLITDLDNKLCIQLSYLKFTLEIALLNFIVEPTTRFNTFFQF